jgi:hypothetical protein
MNIELCEQQGAEAIGVTDPPDRTKHHLSCFALAGLILHLFIIPFFVHAATSIGLASLLNDNLCLSIIIVCPSICVILFIETMNDL